MKKQISRIISFVIIFTMLLSLVSVSVAAAENATDSNSLDENVVIDENVNIFNENTNLEDDELISIIGENLTIETEEECCRIPKQDESDIFVNNVVTTATSTIASGVYKIKNAYNGMYLNVAGTGADAGSAIQQRTGTSTDNNLNQLFKITFLGIYGSPALEYYSIRPMTNSRLGLETSLSGTSRYATVETISTNDAWSSLLYNHLWAISANGTAYTIKNGSASTSSYLTAPANYTQGAAVYTTTSIGSSSKWVFEAYGGEELDHIEWPSKSTMLIAGGTFDYDAYMYSSRIGVNGPLTFSVTNADGTATDKAIINSSTGVVQALKPGQIRVRATYSGAPWIWYWTVTIKQCFVQELVDEGIANPNNIRYTDDGFYILMTPLSTILNSAGVYSINIGTGEPQIVSIFYDDWYLYAIESSNGFIYSMIKMREEENDGGDGDKTGVTISFVELDYSRLIAMIESNTSSNGYQLYLSLLEVTGPGLAYHNHNITDYFASVYSDAAYLVAEEFIQLIANKSCINGIIGAPEQYKLVVARVEWLEDVADDPLLDPTNGMAYAAQYVKLHRITSAVDTNNTAAGYSVYDAGAEHICIADKNNLTMYEKYAILITHTATATFNSFAAEVQYHAEATEDFFSSLNDYYIKAIRADMNISSDLDLSDLDDYYYDLNSDIVRAQAAVHGEY